MSTIKSSEAIDLHRRRFLGIAAMTVAAGPFVMIGSADAQSGNTKPASIPSINPGTNTSFALLKQIDAGVLNVGYAEAGPADGPAVVLLHGWPYDIHSYVDVTPLLAAAGYRVIVPYVRGCSTTRFLSSGTLRNGQQAAVAVDAIAVMDALKIEKAIFAGYDWRGRTADIIAALWPERCKALVSASGYLLASREFNKMPLPGFAVPGQTRGICEPGQWLAQDGFGACIYAEAGVAVASVTARSCLGIGIPSFFSRSANSLATFVR